MHRVDVQTEAGPVRHSPSPTATRASLQAPRSALPYISTRVGIQPAAAFVLLSLAFGSLVIFVTPTFRGPDEISHFLRIYSYSRGELLPPAEVRGRKGIFVERELYANLHFFAYAGEWFATAREKHVRYGQVMVLYREIEGRIDDDSDNPLFLRHSPGPKGTPRSHTFHTFLRR